MPKGSVELTEARRMEIIEACSNVYREKSFKEIKLQDIAEATTFTRTAIYKYYKTKEEIFLGLLQREYEAWNGELKKIYEENDSLSKEQFASLISHSLEERIQLLKLMSMNNFELEAGSRYDRVVEYKRALGDSMKWIRRLLDRFFLEKSEEEKEIFIYSFFPFTFGLYPYTILNEKAVKAMEEAEVGFHYYSIYEMSYNCIVNLLS